jgi:hypothetical protein
VPHHKAELLQLNFSTCVAPINSRRGHFLVVVKTCEIPVFD